MYCLDDYLWKYVLILYPKPILGCLMMSQRRVEAKSGGDNSSQTLQKMIIVLMYYGPGFLKCFGQNVLSG